MASFDLPQPSNTRISPELMVGVASPLWSYFGAAAAGGVAYWWMTRWARPMNLEAMFQAARALPAPPATIGAIDAVAEAVEAAVEVDDDALEAAMGVTDDLPVAPVGGEAGPFSPLLETQFVEREPQPEFEPAPVVEPPTVLEVAPALEAMPEPILDEPAPLPSEAVAELPAKARGKKSSLPPVDPEA